MSFDNNGRSNDAPPPVPEDYRREKPFEKYSNNEPANQAGSWPEPPVNPYRTKPEDISPAWNPYRPPAGDQPPPSYYSPPPPPEYQRPDNYGQGFYQNQQPYPQPQPRPQQRQVQLSAAAPWTKTLLIAIGVMFVIEIVQAGSVGNLFSLAGGFRVDNLVNLGAMDKELVRQGEWWRLITVMFLHASIMHILFNGLALYSFGLQLERFTGARNMLLIYFLGGLAGSILSFGLGQPQAVSVGASGAIFAMLGGLIGFFLKHRDIFGRFGRAQLNSLVFTALLNLVILSMIPQVDNLAHLGGMLGGAFLGYFLPTSFGANGDQVRKWSLVNLWPALALLAIEVALFFIFMGQTPVLG